MDKKFTLQIKEWLETEPGRRDYAIGALYLLKLSGNRIMYRNLTATDPARKANFIEYQLRKYYNFRVADLTHQEVAAMEAETATIVAEHLSLATEADKQQEEGKGRGKRADHEALPDDIKALYVENLSLLQRMRELHLKLRMLSTQQATCPDSERYPFLKEIIRIDKKLHANWEAYDHFIPEQTADDTKRSNKRTAKATRAKKQPGLSK